MSESPVRKRMPLNFSQRLSPGRELRASRPMLTNINSGNMRQMNLDEMSDKIKNVEKKLQIQNLTSSTDLFNSASCEALKFRKNNNPVPNKIEEKPIKPPVLSIQQLRSSWDDIVDFRAWISDKNEVENKNEDTKISLTQSYRMSMDVCPQFGKRSTNLKVSEQNNRIQIPRIEGLGLESKSNKNLKGPEFLRGRIGLKKSLTINQPLSQVDSPTKRGQQKSNQVKNRIKKSMELIQMLKIQQQKQKQKKEMKIIRKKIQLEIINGFRLITQVGKGKFGQVYMARHIETNAIVALKKIEKKKIKQYNMIDQFIKEIKLQNAFDHPKIVKFYGFFEEGDKFYLILEFINGGTLFQYQNIHRTLSISKTVEYLKNIIQAVTQLHNRSIVHRDLKPENIVLTSEGVAKLCDFGWASLVDRQRTTYCGTLQYVSPQILEKKQYDLAVDIWSLGILTYEMLMGHAPFQNKDRGVIRDMILNSNQTSLVYNQDVPIEARQFIEWLIQKDPSKRPKIKELLSHKMFLKYGSKTNKKLH